MIPSGCITMLLGSRLMEPSALIAPGMATFVAPVVIVVTLPLVTIVSASVSTALKLNPSGIIGHDNDGGVGILKGSASVTSISADFFVVGVSVDDAWAVSWAGGTSFVSEVVVSAVAAGLLVDVVVPPEVGPLVICIVVAVGTMVDGIGGGAGVSVSGVVSMSESGEGEGGGRVRVAGEGMLRDLPGVGVDRAGVLGVVT